MMPDFSVAIIGTGFAGIGMAARLKRAGVHDIVLLEHAEALGGTWPDNSYPGAACDDRQVSDPAVRTALTPGYRMGCKRVLLSNDFYPALTQPNVSLVTDRIAEIRDKSIVTRDGSEREVDTIIFGTGFHVTDFPIAQRIHDAEGMSPSTGPPGPARTPTLARRRPASRTCSCSPDRTPDWGTTPRSS